MPLMVVRPLVPRRTGAWVQRAKQLLFYMQTWTLQRSLCQLAQQPAQQAMLLYCHLLLRQI